jgi:hypothetical protein
MNADSLVSRVRDWLNSRLSHRNICVHLRPSAFIRGKDSFLLDGHVTLARPTHYR